MASDDLEKTEEPTSKKLEDAKKEGNVARSQEFSGFVTLFVAIGAMFLLFGYLVDRFQYLYKYYHSMIGVELTKNTAFNVAIVSIKEMVLMVLPIAVVILVAGILGNVSQFGFNFTTKPLVPKFSKINPIKGFKNIVSMKKFIEGAKNTLKVLFVFAVAFYFLLFMLEELPKVTLFSFGDQLEWLVEKAFILAGIVLILFLVFAIADLFIVRYQHKKELRMSKQEVKDEMKQMDGDPKIKAKIREVQMKMAKQRMMKDVPSADVVITNPTHYAVAIRYDQLKDQAPMVVAKGIDLIAQKIKEIARENDVQVVENPPLARELYKMCDLNSSVPQKLYKAVAEVLAFVYNAKKKTT
jgi:flagellar biosynthetic protein FlhB